MELTMFPRPPSLISGGHFLVGRGGEQMGDTGKERKEEAWSGN